MARSFPLMYGWPPKLVYAKLPSEDGESPPEDLTEKYRAALAEIAAGKIASDLTHPLGEGMSMAGRFITIATDALR